MAMPRQPNQPNESQSSRVRSMERRFREFRRQIAQARQGVGHYDATCPRSFAKAAALAENTSEERKVGNCPPGLQRSGFPLVQLFPIIGIVTGRIISINFHSSGVWSYRSKLSWFSRKSRMSIMVWPSSFLRSREPSAVTIIFLKESPVLRRGRFSCSRFASSGMENADWT